MAYHLRNLSTGVDRRCASQQEAHEKVNEIVSEGEDWVIIEMPNHGIGAGRAVSDGVGPIQT
jgi:hypothetical protein